MASTENEISHVDRHASVAVAHGNPENVLEAVELFEPATSGDTSQALPPVDGGRQAWLFLAACFVLEGVAWGLQGFPYSFGVFNTYYSTHPPFSNSKSTIAAIGTTANGLAYFVSPVFSIAMQRWPWTRGPSMLAGLVVVVAALLAASFTNTVPGLMASQGVLYAIGCTLLYMPSNLYVGEWFVKRRGMAFGIVWAGTGTAGVVVPFVLEWLLNTYGFRTALRIWAVVMILMTSPCLFFIKPRLPPTAANAFRPQDLSFVARAPFWLFQVGNIGNAFGCFLPSLWMPSFARSINLPAYAGPMSLAFYNGGYAVGGILLGFVADKFDISVAISMTSIGGMVAAFVFWGLAMSQPMLYIFAILWGLVIGGFNATWPGCATVMRRHQSNGNVDTGIVIGLMAAGKGVGEVASGPLSAKLLDVGWQTHARFAYGTSYGSLIIFCGITAALGGVACFGRMFRVI